ncbi:MAG: tetratricopeptide repeat protein [Saprospiraceae bacterium]|nr:tetratricopeptide repeat protein [Saprospiraceae bacterium]
MNTRLSQLQNLLAESPNDAFLLFAIAKEYEGMGEQEQALAHYLQLIEKDSTYVGTYYHLAKLYEKIEQPEKALETYSKGMDIARKADDQHALAELSSAKLNLEFGN